MPGLVIITGASSGLGLAIARAVPFAARIVDLSRSGPPAGEPFDHIVVDLADPAQWDTAIDAIGSVVAETDPDRSAFVHCAGTLTPIGFAGEVETAAYRRNVILNSAVGQVLGHAYLSALEGRPGTHDLVMISSGAATSVYPGWSAYGAGKAALDQWVRTVGAEQRERGGVTVSAIAPGVVATEMQAEIRHTERSDFPQVERFRALHDEGRLVPPDVAAARFWQVVEDGLEPGSVIDLRDRF